MSYPNLTHEEVEAAKVAKDQLGRLIRQRKDNLKLLRGEMKPDDYQTSPKPAFHIPPQINSFPHYSAGHDPRNYDRLMQERRQQFHRKQDDNAIRLREFNVTRAYLLDERQRLVALREKVATRPISPIYDDEGHRDYITDAWEHIRLRPDQATARIGWQSPGGKPVAEIMADTKSKLPIMEQRFNISRKFHEQKKQRMNEPYDGSLGKKSYEPWQIPHYDVCRKIIENEVTKLLEKLLPIDGKDYVAERKLIDEQMNDMVKQKAIQLLNEELIFEVIFEEAEATANEYHYLNKLSRNMADQACIIETEVRSTGTPEGRTFEDPTHQLVAENFFKSQRIRNEQNPDVWVHSQYLIIRNPTAKDLREQDQESNIATLEYGTLPPAQLKQIYPLKRDESTEYTAWIIKRNFWSNELLYWSKFDVSNTTFTIPSNTKTITTLAMCRNASMIAIGTQNGTILVYQVGSSKNNIFRLHLVSPLVASAPKKTTLVDPIIHLSWSNDNIRLVSTTLNGVITVWSVGRFKLGSAQTVDKSLKSSGEKYFPGVLVNEFRMSRARRDFLFRSGPLRGRSSSQDETWGPKYAQFLPTFSLIGSAPILCVGMSNNVFLRIDGEHNSSLNRRTETSVQSNEEDTGNDFLQKRELFKVNYNKVEGEHVPPHKLLNLDTGVDLFRGHKHPIIFMRFLNNMDEIVTVDDQAYLMVWLYNSKYLSRGTNYWFDPIRRCRISMKLELFEINGTQDPQTHFDRISADSMFNTKEHLRRAESQIAEADFRHPMYKYENVKSNYVTRIYRNTDEKATESGAILHEVSRLITTDELLIYTTRLYGMYVHFADAFLGCAANQSCTRLTALILYPPDPPDHDAWIEVINIDLSNLTVCEPRIQINLEVSEYRGIREQGTIFFNITSPVKFIGAEYLVINILGKINIYSLLTGQHVLKTISRAPLAGSKKTFFGLQIVESKLKQRKDSEILMTVLNRRLCMLSYSIGANYINVQPFEDKNSSEMSSKMVDLAAQLDTIGEGLRDFPSPSKDTSAKPFYLAQSEHSEGVVRSWLYEAMEKALEQINGSLPVSLAKKYQMDDRKCAYDSVVLPEVRANIDDDEVEAAPAAEPANNEEVDQSKQLKWPDFMD